MQLIHLYIIEHKAIYNLNIPLSGSFTCQFHWHEGASLKQKEGVLNYYNGFHCSAIIGPNGGGKSSILDFVSALDSSSNSRLVAVFFDKEEDEYHLCLVNIQPEEIPLLEVDKKCTMVSEIEEFLRAHRIQFAKVNSLSEGFGFFEHPVKKKKKRYLKELTISENVSSEAKKRDTSRNT